MNQVSMNRYVSIYIVVTNDIFVRNSASSGEVSGLGDNSVKLLFCFALWCNVAHSVAFVTTSVWFWDKRFSRVLITFITLTVNGISRMVYCWILRSVGFNLWLISQYWSFLLLSTSLLIVPFLFWNGSLFQKHDHVYLQTLRNWSSKTKSNKALNLSVVFLPCSTISASNYSF